MMEIIMSHVIKAKSISTVVTSFILFAYFIMVLLLNHNLFNYHTSFQNAEKYRNISLKKREIVGDNVHRESFQL